MVEQAILRTRAELREGPHVIGWALGIAASTVHAVLSRHGCSRLVVRPREQVVRYECASPGELVHVDVKKLGRIVTPGHRVTGDRSVRAAGRAGWQYLFVAIDVECPRFRGQLSAGLSGPAERLSGHAKEAEVPKAVPAGVSA